MNVKALYLITTAFLLAQGEGFAQAYANYRSPPPQDLQSTMKQFKIGLADLKHEVYNHENEIRIFENKLQNQEAAFDQLRQQITEDVQSQRDFTKASNIHLEGKTETLDQAIKSLDQVVKGNLSDLRQMKTQANDSIAVLSQYKQKLTELEKLIEVQNQHMQHLEAALQSMMEVWQAKEATQSLAMKGNEEFKSYKVQSGDTLEKIARAQKISVQALRNANPQLKNDRIIVGQNLKIPYF